MGARLRASDLKTAPEGRHFLGEGLYFRVRGSSRVWIYRYQIDGARRDVTLGKYPDMSLKSARDARYEMARLKERGYVAVRRRRHRSHTLRSWVGRWMKANRHDLKDGGRSGRWLSPLRVHVMPVLGQMDVRAITFEDIKPIFDPIWRTKTSAAAKGMDRLGMVMRYAEAELPEVDVRIVPRVRVALGKQRHKATPIPSMPWREVPTFYATLETSPAALALRLLILTASRSRPVRMAHVDQFEGDVWTIPAANMKGGNEFRVPLSDEAMRVIDLARPLARNGFLFCAVRGKPISDMSMTALMNRRKLDYRPHGFRSSFRTWAEDTAQDWTLAEVSLDHTVGNKVERTYQRSDLLYRRAPLMQLWSDTLGV
ncbi:tyrosine-type recombinase/integrase [Tateyamaria pelophila]|uniref:tyrosine-type recombinase/integrase n=1 Tax=Tateyamaria pelophila TaxID=328415 RepID=UPI001CBE9F5F|nr:integrase arm-type DNA-binding domain-containing protein [Tateyamaria pelophila]